MSRRMLLVGATTVPLFAVLCTTSPIRAQTSALGHVPARTAYAPPVAASSRPFGIYPGDHLFQAAMKIEYAYQAAERSAPPVVYRPPPRPVVVREALVEVSVTEPAGPMETVRIRGPNGEVRSFPIAGGRQAIRAQTILVRPGQSVNLLIRGGHVEVRGERSR
jgi:hypothetical protein